MNAIQERINNAIKMYHGRRLTGRTTTMIKEIFKFSMENKEKNIVVLAQTNEEARRIMNKLVEKLRELDLNTIHNPTSKSVTLNENEIVFREVAWEKSLSYKCNDWDITFRDNSISDKKEFEYIEQMQNELL